MSSGPGTFVWSMDIAAGDLDGDSTVDVFVANYGEPDAVFFNDGTGNFTDSGQLLGYGLSAAVALGDLDGAISFIDWLADAGVSVWQFLPLGPTDHHGSPYSSWSALSGNPDLVGEAVEEGNIMFFS